MSADPERHDVRAAVGQDGREVRDVRSGDECAGRLGDVAGSGHGAGAHTIAPHERSTTTPVVAPAASDAR